MGVCAGGVRHSSPCGRRFEGQSLRGGRVSTPSCQPTHPEIHVQGDVVDSPFTSAHASGGNRGTNMNKTTSVLTCLTLVLAAGIAVPLFPQAQGGVPRYQVDASWPKPLPARWVLGGLGG